MAEYYDDDGMKKGSGMRTTHHNWVPNTDSMRALGIQFTLALLNGWWITFVVGAAVAFPGPNGALAIIFAKLMAYAYSGSIIGALNTVDLVVGSILDEISTKFDGVPRRNKFTFRLFAFFVRYLAFAIAAFAQLGFYRWIFGATTFNRFIPRIFPFAPNLIANSNQVAPIGLAIILFFVSYMYHGLAYLNRHDANRVKGTEGYWSVAIAMCARVLVGYILFSYIEEPLYTLAAGAYSAGTWPAVSHSSATIIKSNANSLWAYLLVPYLVSPVAGIIGYLIFLSGHKYVSGREYEARSNETDVEQTQTQTPPPQRGEIRPDASSTAARGNSMADRLLNKRN